MIATEIRPRLGGHRDDGHEEEILQADSDTKKKKVTNKHHQRIRTRGTSTGSLAWMSARGAETILRDGFRRITRRTVCTSR